MVKTSNRNSAIDIAKAISMFLIIITHVLQRTLPGYVDGWGASLLFTLAVPVFFFLSGASHGQRNSLTPIGFVFDFFKRALAYFLPLIWFLAFRVWFYSQWSDFPTAFSTFLDNPSYGLWVLWILTWLVVLTDIGLLIPSKNKWIKKAWISLFLVVGFVTMIILRKTWVLYNNFFLGYDLFIFYTPCFLLGIWAGEIWYGLKKWWLELSFFAVGLIVLFIICPNNQSFIPMNKIEHLALYYLACLMGTMTMIGLSGLLARMKWSKPIAFAGRFTIEAYFLHLTLLKNWAPWNPGDNWHIFIISVGLTLLCLANTIAVTAVSYVIPFFHFALFGRPFSIYKFENRLYEKLFSLAKR